MSNTQINTDQVKDEIITNAKVSSELSDRIDATKIDLSSVVPGDIGASPVLTFNSPLSKTGDVVSLSTDAFVTVQETSPGTEQTGNFNVTGKAIFSSWSSKGESYPLIFEINQNEVARISPTGCFTLGSTASGEFFNVGLNNEFQVTVEGDIRRIRGVQYVWPADHAVGVLTDGGGTGDLSWTPMIVSGWTFAAGTPDTTSSANDTVVRIPHNLQVGNSGSISSNVASQLVTFFDSLTGVTATGTYRPLQTVLEVNWAGTDGETYYGLSSYVTLTDSFTSDSSRVAGIHNQVVIRATGASHQNNIYGAYNEVTVSSGDASSDIQNVYGLANFAINTGDADVAQFINLYVPVVTKSGAGEFTNIYGIYIDDQATTTPSNYKFQLYSKGGAPSWFEVNANVVPLTIKGSIGQTEVLFAVKNSGGDTALAVDADKSLYVADAKFIIGSGGNIVKLNNVDTQFPDSNSAGVLTNNGVGVLTWEGSTSGWSGFSGYSGDNPGTSGWSGFSGDNPGSSGWSGFSGISGYSGAIGPQGDSGISGYSGHWGASGSGISGFSGFSGAGVSGYSGISGFSGFSGLSGWSGISGFSGSSGKSGYSGVSGLSGFSGSGVSGFSGISGWSGISGFSGENPGASGTSGKSGWSGVSGFSGSGVSGFSGFSGIGTSGFSGRSGASGWTGSSGISGFSGVSGWSGISGASNTSGWSGFSGISGWSGFSGKSGWSGFSGESGWSGFSGISGWSGESNTSGWSGFSGESGWSGFSGESGWSGFSGSGISGLSGWSGFSGSASLPTIWVQTADASIANTATETSILSSTGVGSKTLAANFLTAGKTIHIVVKGNYSTNQTQTQNRVRLKLGSTYIGGTTSDFTFGPVGGYATFSIDAYMTCRTTGASGTVRGWARMEILNTSGAGDPTVYWGAFSHSSSATIDTTATQAIDVTFKFSSGAGSSTITSEIVAIEAYG